MGCEIELKLALSPAYGEQLLKQKLLERCTTGHCRADEVECKILQNIYFDTPERALAAEKVALRIRRDGERYIQTLKTAGSAAAGLSVRREWEWPLTTAQLDLQLLKPHLPPALQQDAVLASLAPQFETNFTREVRWIRGAATEGEKSWVVEVALDRGEVLAAGLQEPICELEFELKQGSPALLFEVALELARQLPLLPQELSKAQRGYRLQQQAQGVCFETPSLLPRYGADIEQTLVELIADAVRIWPVQLRDALQTCTPERLGELKRTLDLQLAALQGLPDVAEHCGVLISQYQRLREMIAAAYDWRLLEGMPEAWQAAQRQIGSERVQQLAHKTLPGQLALATGQLLWQIRDDEEEL